MRILPPAPSPGDRVSATLLRELIRYVRASTPIAGTGLKSRASPNGTILSVAPQASKAAAAADKSCWRIVAQAIQAQANGETVSATVHVVDRQYYQVGGMLFEGADQTTLESFVEDGKPFIAARIVFGGGAFNVASLVGYESFAAMQADSLDRRWSIIPLYELKLPDRSGESEGADPPPPPPIVVVQDFRAIPLVQAFEMPHEGGIA